jgi:NAD(P)-dependent dehydrogenase (short-subunit alcohol dehydrogenase family)
LTAFAGKRALITGGASGIGLATARKLAHQGARVALLDLDRDKTDAAAKEVGGVAVCADVRDAAAVDAACSDAAAAFGGLDLAFLNAGAAAASSRRAAKRRTAPRRPA